MYTYIHMKKHIYTYGYMYICMYVYEYKYVHMYIYICTYMCTYMHIWIHIIYIHTCTYIFWRHYICICIFIGIHWGMKSYRKSSQNYSHSSVPIDWCCFYYLVRNSLIALLEALCARNHNRICQIPFDRDRDRQIKTVKKWEVGLDRLRPKKN